MHNQYIARETREKQRTKIHRTCSRGFVVAKVLMMMIKLWSRKDHDGLTLPPTGHGPWLSARVTARGAEQSLDCCRESQRFVPE